MPELLSIDFPGNHLLILAFGLALLLAGRRIFWLVLGVLGFLFGFDFATQVLGLDSRGLGLLIALLAGVVGVFVAVFIQRLAVALAGFLIGGYLTLTVLGAEVTSLAASDLLAFILGGILAAFLAVWLFEAALILLSSVAGAALVSGMADFQPGGTSLAFFLLVVVGLAVQAGIGPKRRRRVRG